MISLTVLGELFDYNYWARDRQLEACATLTIEQFLRPLGNSFSSLRDTLAHLVGAEWIWLERWLGHTPRSMPAWELTTTAAVGTALAGSGRRGVDTARALARPHAPQHARGGADHTCGRRRPLAGCRARHATVSRRTERRRSATSPDLRQLEGRDLDLPALAHAGPSRQPPDLPSRPVNDPAAAARGKSACGGLPRCPRPWAP